MKWEKFLPRFALVLLIAMFISGSLIMVSIWRHDGMEEDELHPVSAMALETEEPQTIEGGYTGRQEVYTLDLPEEIGMGTCLCFSLRHEYYEVLCEGESIEWVRESRDWHLGHTPGNLQVTMEIPEELAGKQLTVIVTPVYRSRPRGKIPFTLASRADWISYSLEKDMHLILLCFLAIVTAMALLLLSFVVFGKGRTRTGLLYLTLLAFLAGNWKLLGIPTIILLFERSTKALYYMGMIDFILLPVISLQLIYYRKQGWNNQMHMLMSALVSIGAIVSFGLQLLGIMDLHDILPFLMARICRACLVSEGTSLMSSCGISYLLR